MFLAKKVDAVLTNKSKEALKVMAENPSVDTETVEKIKEKIGMENIQSILINWQIGY